jgi:hypothetical protein
MAAKAAAGLILVASTVFTASIANAAVCTNYCSTALCSTYTTSLSCTMAAVLASEPSPALTATPTDTSAAKCFWDISKEGASCQTTSSAQTIPCCAPK